MDTSQQRAFIRSEIFSSVLMATTQRGNVYSPSANEDEKVTFRCNLRSELVSLVDEYTNKVTDEQHFSNIQRLAESISKKHPSLLLNQRFRIGSSQKALNLWLKYLWCLDWIPIPPHCPFDAIVLSKIPGCENVRWTKFDSVREYSDIVCSAKQAANKEPLALWELNLYNVYAHCSRGRAASGTPLSSNVEFSQ